MDSSPIEMPSLTELRNRIDQELATAWKLYLAKRDEIIVGMLALKPRETILDQIFVLTSEQGDGVCFALRMASSNCMAAGFINALV